VFQWRTREVAWRGEAGDEQRRISVAHLLVAMSAGVAALVVQEMQLRFFLAPLLLKPQLLLVLILMLRGEVAGDDTVERRRRGREAEGMPGPNWIRPPSGMSRD
jgi:hypothetical protein